MDFLKKHSHKIILSALLAFSFFLIFFNLSKSDLGHFREENHENALPQQKEWITLNNDFLAAPMHYHFLNYHEYRYSTVAQEVLETNEWRTLRVKNFEDTLPYYHKGPFYFLLTAITAKIFSFSKFIVRFWPALFGFGVILVTYLLGRNIFNKKVGLLSAFILTTTFQFIHVDGARAVSVDTIFIFFMMLAIYLLFKKKDKPKLFYLGAVSIGLAGLTRSVFMTIPLLFLFLSVDFSQYFSKKKMIRLFKKWFLGVIIILTIVLPWVALQYHYGGQEYIENIKRFQIKEEFLGKLKLASPEMYDNFQYDLFLYERPGDYSFYTWTIYKGFFPWSILIVLALIYSGKIFWKEKNRKLLTVLLIIFFIYLFVTIKQQNWVRYAINFYPYFAIIVAKLLYDFYKNKGGKLLSWGILVTFFVFLPVLVPYGLNFVWIYYLLLFSLLGGYIFLKNKKQFFASLIILHFIIIALVNITQPFI